MKNIHTHSFELGGKNHSFETGRLALQADGAVMFSHGESVLMVTAGMGKGSEDADFFPLTVDFEPKYYATGKIKGSRFIKREGRPPESAILISRMIDRTMRPLFDKRMRNETQVIGYLFQSDGKRNVGPSAITAASVAVGLAGLPIESLFAGVRVGQTPSGEFILDPSFEEIEKGGMDLIVAGTADAITMVEGKLDLLGEELTLKALEFAHKAIQTLCAEQATFIAKKGEIEIKTPTLGHDYAAEKEALKSVLSAEDLEKIKGETKKEVKTHFAAAEEKLMTALADKVEDGTLSASGLAYALDKAFAATMRDRVFASDTRLDGRKPDEVRPLESSVSIFPRLHGSAVFQRGETQAFSVVTVGGASDAQLLDDADRPEFHKNYFHHYNFPPFSVGEVRRLRGTSRREVGHGYLAENALVPVIPKKEDGFPYTLRVVSEIMTCNGSSSMASVCGSTLSLMDAGIPIKAPIAGIAMGLLTNESGDYKILTDIQGFEDFDGDMDLKIAGSTDGITAIQMDIKLKGLKMDLLREAFGKAKTARLQILDNMTATIAAPRDEMNEFAPRISSFMINPDDIRLVIGKGGETIQKITADFDVKIDIEDDGQVMVQSVNQENAQGAIDFIQNMLYEPEVGDVFEAGIVKSIMDFGVFVEFLPGKEALVHVSEMDEARVAHPSDKVSEGDIVRVKMVGKDKMGRIKLSMKQA